MKVIGYVRVSTEEQAREGISLEAQRHKITAWAEALDGELLFIAEDAGISGKHIRNRDGLRRAIEATCTEQAALVVYSLSRLSRSTRDTLMVADKLDKAGADLVSLSERIDTTTAAGKMVFRMLAVLTEFERDQISERTSAILQHKKAKGEVYSPIPFGFRQEGDKLLIDEEEQDVIRHIKELKMKGLSLRRIAAKLNKQGTPAKRGGVWYASSVREMVNREE
jgi:DNA invertase Pin-like site-specific DNA recombinase